MPLVTAEEQMFCDRITIAPTDPTPRLVLADMLDERGEHDRAATLRKPGWYEIHLVSSNKLSRRQIVAYGPHLLWVTPFGYAALGKTTYPPCGKCQRPTNPLWGAPNVHRQVSHRHLSKRRQPPTARNRVRPPSAQRQETHRRPGRPRRQPPAAKNSRHAPEARPPRRTLTDSLTGHRIHATFKRNSTIPVHDTEGKGAYDVVKRFPALRCNYAEKPGVFLDATGIGM